MSKVSRAAAKSAAKKIGSLSRRLGRMSKTTRKMVAYGIVVSVVALAFAVGIPMWPKPVAVCTDGTDGSNGSDGTVGVNGFNGTAADYTVYAAPDNSWYVAVPGIPSLPLYNETVFSTLMDETILALNGSVVRGGLIRVLKGYYPLTHAILLDPEVTL
jgi:hypothetical protein